MKRDGKVVTIIFTITLDSMKKKYEDDGYTVEVVSKEQLTQMSTVYGEVEWGFLATKDLTTSSVLCFKNSEDAKKAKEGAKNANSLAKVELDIRIITVTTTTNADSMKKKYEDAGYTVEVAPEEDLAEDETVEWALVAIKGLNIATITCFKDAKDAEKAEKEAKDAPAAKVKRDGKVVIVANTEVALNAK